MAPSLRIAAWIGGGMLAGTLALFRLRPALLHDARVTDVESRPGQNYSLARLSWHYRPGARPVSLIIDLTDEQGNSGSLTIDGERTSGAIPVAAPLHGNYALTATSVHRLAGFARRHRQTFRGVL